MSRADRHGLGAAILSGLLLALCFPKADLGWLGFIALVPLFRAARATEPRRAFRLGTVAGAVFFLVLLYWLIDVMTVYGGLPTWVALGFLALLVSYLALYVGVFAALVSAASRRWGAGALLGAPVFWVGLELIRGRFLTGFPWGLMGYSQWRNLPLAQAGAWGGVYAVSFILVLVNAAIALLLEPAVGRGSRRLAVAVLILAAVAEGAGVAALRAVASGDGAPLAVAAIQADVPQDRKWRPGEEEAIVADLLAMSDQAAQEGARLVVWPESSSPWSFRRPVRGTGVPAGGVIERRRDYLDRVGELARRRGITLIAGSVDYRFEDGRLLAFNSALVIGPDGALGESYDKTHLVPFGEYVPLSHLLFFVDRLVQGAIAEFAPGTRLEPLDTPAGKAATFVCYEAIFPELVRRLAGPSAFLVNITNDAWFGRSAAPRQHLAMAVFRAVENRRWLLRAANTGISAIIDPAGRVRASTPLEAKTILAGSIAPRVDRTVYAATGDVLAWACAILTLLSAAALRAAFLRPGS
jgi:apolipoprotein N-acyltransferase